MNFPYDGKSQLSASSDPVVTELQGAHLRLEDLLLATLRKDTDVQLIVHFDGDLQGHLGQPGTGSGAIRYREGRFAGSSGVLIEESGQNLLPNPSAEVDLTHWQANDPAVALTRSTDQAYTEDDTVSVASFKLAGTSKAGPGYIHSDAVSVFQNSFFSASAYVYSEKAIKARLEMAFSGGTPVSYDSGEVALAAGEWTRLEVEDKGSDDNDSCELRLYLVQEAPEYAEGSRFSRLAPSATALVTDGAMAIAAGDVVMCALLDNPPGPEEYSWHMATTGGTGVSDPALRLDDEVEAPVFVPGSRFSKWTPGDTVETFDNAVTLNAGDLVFCDLEDEGYGWRLVTTAGTAGSPALRLDDRPNRPEFAPGSRVSRIAPTATAVASDEAMAIAAGDIVLSHTLEDPAGSGYDFHLVTTGATGVSSGDLRLDDAPAAPTLASGSRFSKLSPSATALVTDEAMAITAGDFAMAAPTANPAGAGYGWHMATAGATGVSSTSLRLDQCSSETLYADAVQLESGEAASSYIDSFQGTGFSGEVGQSSTREDTRLSFPASGILGKTAGTVAFWIQPFWDGDDQEEHVLFDAAVGSNRNRIRLSKSDEDRLVLSIYDGQAELLQAVADSGFTFLAGTWQHLGFSYDSGTLALYHDGEALSASTVGSGSGELAQVPADLHLGSDRQGDVVGGAVFDDLVVKSQAAAADEMEQMALGNAPYQGLALSQSGFAMAVGASVTDGTAGVQSAVAHGLGVAPGFVVITERGNGTVYLSAEADATNIYVKGSASSIDFDWRAYA